MNQSNGSPKFCKTKNFKQIFFQLIILFFSLQLFGQSDFYWVGGSGNWSNYSSHWATSSGGNIFHTTSPGSNDKVIFDSNSFSQANQTVTLDSDNNSFKDMSWLGVTDNPKFNMSGKTLEVHGKVEYDPNMQFQSVGTLSFVSSSTGSIISGGHNLGNINVRKPSGTFHLLSPIRTSSFYVENGSTFHTNDYNMRSNYIYFYGGTTTTTIYTGTSELLIEGGSLRVYYQSNSPSLKYLEANIVSSTIILDNAELVGRYIHHPKQNDINFGHVISRRSSNRQFGEGIDRVRKFEIQKGDNYENNWQYIHNYFEGIIDTLDIESKKVKFNTSSNRNPKIGVFNVKGDGVTLEISHGSTITVSSSLSFQSSSCSVVNIKSNSAGNQATINYVSGVTTATNLSIRDISFTGSGTITALNSVDGGNNTGITISEDAPRNMYWIGGTGNWSDPAHWSTSDGGSGNVCAPTPNDNIFFTSNSFSAANQVITLNVDNIGIVNMDWTGVTNNPKFNMGGKTMEITGSVTYTADMTFQSAGTLTFLSTDTTSIYTAEVNTNSARNIGNINVRKPSGTFHLLSPIRTSSFYVENGSTFHTNDYNMRSNYIYFYGGTTTTTIYTGTSELLIEGGSLRVYYQSNSPSLKYLEANIVSSTIILDNAELVGRYIHHPKQNDINFGHVISRRSSNRQFGEGIDRVRKFEIQKGDNYENNWQYIHNYFEGIIDTLDIESKKVKFNTSSNRNPKIGVFNVKGDGVTLEISHGSTITVSSSLSFQSSSCSVVNIKSNSAGNQATINYVSGVTTATNLSIRDISFTGSGTITALNSVDGGNNTGITISQQAPRNMYWIGGTGNWSDPAHWSTSDGGSGNVCAPTPNDNIFFTSNSFSAANQVITLNVDNIGIVNMDWTGVTNNPKFNMGGKTMEITGSVTYTADMTFQSAGTLTFLSTDTTSIYTAEVNTNSARNIGNINVRKPSGTFHLLSPIRTSSFYVENGSTFHTNDYNMRSNYIYFYGGTTTTTIYTGTSELLIEGGSLRVYYQSNSPSLKYLEANIVSSTIILDNAELVGRYIHHPKQNDINFGHVISRRSSNRQFGEGIDRVRKFEIQKGDNYENNWQYIHNYFEGIIDTLDIESKKVKFNTSSNRNPKIGVFNVKGDGATIEISHGSTITVSNTLNFESKSGTRNYIKSNSSGSQATINYHGSDVCADYIRIKDITLVSSSTISLGPYSQNEGNTSGFNFNTDTSNTISGMTISVSPTGLSYYENQRISFVLSSTYSNNNSATFHFFVNSQKTQSGTSTIFNGNNLKNGDKVFGSVEIPYAGTVTGCNFTTIGKTDEITLNLDLYPVITSSTYSQTNNTVAVTFNEPVFTESSGSGNLIPSDFELLLTGGTAVLNSNQPTSLSKSGNTYTLGLNISNQAGSEVLTIKPKYNEIFDKDGRRSDQNQSNNSVRLGTVSASLLSAAVSSDNLTVMVTFSENVFSTVNGSGFLEPSNFILEMSGGTATLSSTTPISIFSDNFKHSLGFTFGGIPDGNEVINVKLADNSIFDVQGVVLPQIQTNSSSNLKPDSDSDGIANPIDLCPNTASGTIVNMNGCADNASKYFWVGGSGNWSDFSNHWATTSGGNQFHSRAPNGTDNAYFDRYSFTNSGQTITIDTDLAAVKNMTWTGVTNNPTFNFNGKNLDVFGSVVFAENMTINSANMDFMGTSSATLDTKNKHISTIYLKGSDLTLASPLDIQSFYIKSGSFITNNYDLNTYRFDVDQTSNTSLTIDLGTSTVINTYELEWDTFRAGNYTTSVSSSTIIVKGRTWRDYGSSQWGELRVVELPNQWWSSVEFNANSNVNIKSLIASQTTDKINLNIRNVDEVDISSSANITNLNTKILKLKGNGSIYQFSGTINVSNTLEIGVPGGCAITTFKSTSDGNTATINSADTTTANYLDIKDIIFNGISSGSLTANNSIDNGNNSGFTINTVASRDFYWVGGTGDWSDGNEWSFTSGGNAVGCPPSSGDNVFFDSNSFTSSGQTVKIDIDNAAVNNMNWTGVVSDPTFNFNGKNLDVFGSVVFAENMTINSANMDFMGTSSATLDTKNKHISTIYLKGSDLTLASPLDIQSFYIKSGSFITNNYDLNTYRFDVDQTSNTSLTIDLGTSTVINTYELEWDTFRAGNYTTSVSSSTIIVKGRTWRDYGSSQWGELRVVELPNQWWSSVEFNANSNVNIKSLIASQTTDKINLNIRNVDEVDISSSANITNLNTKILKLKGNGSIYQFSGTINVSNTLEIGVPGGCAITTFKSTSDGNTATINSDVSAIAAYLDVKDIIFTSSNSATLTANNSIDNGNNSGINFGLLGNRTFYWVGGTGNWSEGSHWSSSPGGVPSGCPPSSGDNVFFDSNSFTSSGQTVKIDIENAGVNDMTWTGVTNNPTFNFNGKNLDVFGSVVFAENMTINSANMDFMGTSSATLDTKNKHISTIYLKGSDLTLASPLDIQSFYIKSGSFITNNYDLNTYRFDVDQTSNTSLTIDLGTSTVINTYELEWDTFRAGNYTTSVSSSTIIVKGRTWRDYGSSQWGELRVVELPNQWWSSVEFNANSNVNIKSLIANQTTDKINLNIRNVDEVDISSSANITNLNTKILKLKGNGAVYQMGGTINVSNTLDITSNLGVVNSFSSNSNGNQSIINYNNPLCVDYISIKDINFTNTTTVTAGPNSVNNGNNLGVEFFTDNNITIQAFTINSSMGTSIADFEESSFTATSTSGFDQNMIFNWYVDNILKQSGPSISFSPGLITENYTVECATEIPYNGGQGNSSCSFVVKAKSNSINMSVSSKPIIKETKITQDNQYIKVRFSKPVFTNSNGTGELTANDFRLYLNGGNATLSGSYPNSVVKDGDFYKLTFGLNGKFNGEEEITVKPNGNSNIYDNQGQGAEQDNQSNNTVKLNYNPPIIDGVSVNSALNELTIVFSEPVNGSDQSPYNVPLKYNVLHLSVSGGSATLNSPLPNSISGNLDTYKVGFTLSGTPNGNEIFQVTPVFNSIFDLQGFPASHLQDYNTTCTNCDSDNDGVIDARDTCPNTVSGTTVDQNGCSDDQKDSDYDGVPDYLDYCLNTVLGTEVNANGCAETQTNQQSPPTQVNNSSSQNESTLEVVEVNPEDLDGDGYLNSVDAFPNDPSEYLDTDVDGIGDNADQDDDNDGFTDSDEALCKTNPKDSNSLPTDNDGDQIVDCIDTDDDNDGVEDKRDAFPMDDSEYLDTDKDGIGNNADEDDDGDGYKDQDEIACESDPLKRFSKPRDYDGDLIPDCIDTDDDDDGCLDEQDLFPLNERECEDSDGDGIGDNSDIDADNDGIIDEFDDFPTDPNESKDTDGDGIGDNADLDDNNDGFPEDPVINSAGEEVIPIFVSGLLTPNQTGEESKWRIVNIDKYPTANVKIYSPSGEVVYESWSYNNDWDGKDKNGKPLPTGPYLYIIDRGVETLVEEGWLYIYN